MMILPLKADRRLKAFTLIEVLVSLTIISIATLSTLAVFSNMSFQIRFNSEEREIYSLIESKLVSYAVADDLKKVLFTPKELEFFNTNRNWPVFAPLVQTNIGSHTLFITRKIRRWKPLLVDVGMEAILRYRGTSASNKRIRRYWAESSFSESVVKLYQ